jgi:Sec-independent protein translocase protein TatA
MSKPVEQRLSIVETALAEFIRNTDHALSRLEREMREFKDEMRDFKDEMREFKDEMSDFKDEMRDFKDEMSDFKDEMREFKDEMKEFKEEVRNDHKEMNKQWGALANKMGTVVEDIISPAVGPAVRKYFDEELVDIMIRRKKRDKSKNLKGEFDVIALTDTSVYLVETKVSPEKREILKFKNEVLPRFRELFPEYDKLKLIPIFASLRFEPELIEFATQEKLYLLAYREWEYMDILNFDLINQ